jgi:hypothetical protein
LGEDERQDTGGGVTHCVATSFLLRNDE